jgi:GTP pyrophosphokinase
MSNNSTPHINSYAEEFDQFLQNHPHIFKTTADKEFLMQVFNFSADAHKNMLRYSGAPFISHPLEVAKIVTQRIGLGKTSVAAALLHDIPNKTEYTIADIERYFGKKIAGIVGGLTKIKNTEYFADNQEASVFREILLSMSEDIRVIFIKIADKLHSIRTIDYLSLRKQKRTVNEVLNIYAPLAHRLGLFEIKSEMEDLCLRQTNPGIYTSIQNKIKSNEREKLQHINRFLIPVKEQLEQTAIEFRVQSRAKSIYSVWKKIQQKRVPLKEIYDLYAVRIIFKSKPKEANSKALQIADIIRKLYPDKPDRTRNWLDTPKETGYRAYHITVKSNEGFWVEVQIRSEIMHAAAEHGLAAHWRYKGIKDRKNKLDEKISEILKKLKSGGITGENFMDALKQDIFTTEIYVFTPKGQIISLPKGATVLDFAFKIHTKLAATALSAKVNGQVVPLNAGLKSGDRVEIIASEKSVAKKEWFDYVTTHRALTGLKHIFREDRKKHEDIGRDKLENLLENENIFDITTATHTLKKVFNYNSTVDFYIDLSEGKIPKNDLLFNIHLHCTNVRANFWVVKIPDKKFKNRGTESVETANCCRPVPEEPIVAAYAKNKQISIHAADCRVLKNEKGLRTTPAFWASYASVAYREKINIIGKNTKNALKTVIGIPAQNIDVKVKQLNWNTEKKTFYLAINLFVKNKEALNRLIDEFKTVPEISEVIIGSEEAAF